MSPPPRRPPPPPLPSHTLSLLVGLKQAVLPPDEVDTLRANGGDGAEEARDTVWERGCQGTIRGGGEAAARRPADGAVTRACGAWWAARACRVYGLDAAAAARDLEAAALVCRRHGAVLAVADVILAVARQHAHRHAALAAQFAASQAATASADIASGSVDGQGLGFEEFRAQLHATVATIVAVAGPGGRGATRAAAVLPLGVAAAAAAYHSVCAAVEAGELLPSSFARVALELAGELLWANDEDEPAGS